MLPVANSLLTDTAMVCLYTICVTMLKKKTKQKYIFCSQKSQWNYFITVSKYRLHIKKYYFCSKQKNIICQPEVQSVALIKVTLHRSSAEHKHGFINT